MELDIVDYLITSISDLPGIVSIPGLAVCAFLAFRALGLFITLRWIRAATNLVYIAIILLVLAKYGQNIADFIQENQTPETPTESQT